MPPVAEGEGPLGRKLAELLTAKTNGIGSRRELAKRTSTIKKTTLEGERKSVRLHMAGERAEEPSIVAYAKAFNRPRHEFPPAEPRKSRAEELQLMVERIAQQREADLIARIPPDLSGPLAALQATVAKNQETIEALQSRLAALEQAYIAAQTPPAAEGQTPRSRPKKAAGGSP